MQLQPSTQSWRVIWVRDGSALIWSSVSASGRSTRPSTISFQLAKFSSHVGLIVGVGRVDRAVGLEGGGDVGAGELPRQSAAAQQPLHPPVQHLGAGEHLHHVRVLGDLVAAGQPERGQAGASGLQQATARQAHGASPIGPGNGGGATSIA